MFPSSFPLGRIGGVPVRAHWSVLIVLGLLTWLLATEVLPAAARGHAATAYWLTAGAAALCFLASLLAHELTHAFTARRQQIVVKSITLWALGGATEMETAPASPGADLRVAVNGPLTSLAIGGGCFGAAVLAGGAMPALVTAGLSWVGLTNLVLGGFNLLPGAPLDGGRVLRALVWRRTGDRVRAAAVAATTGQALGAALIVVGLAELLIAGWLTGLWLGFVGWFLIGSAQLEAASEIARERLAGIRLRQVMDPRPVTASGWWTVDTFVERTAVHTRQRAFPVVSFDGRVSGVVHLRDLARLTPQQRIGKRVSDVGSPARRAGPDDRVTDILTSGALRRSTDLILVVENGVLAGTFSATDLARTMELAALGARPVTV